MLLEIEAVHFRPEDPYKLTSGWASPVYIDCRKLVSYPRVRQSLMDFAASIVLRDIGFESLDAVAGGETAGIPFAAWLADRLMLPMQYVRKQPKGFGRDARIEGYLAEGARVLLVGRPRRPGAYLRALMSISSWRPSQRAWSVWSAMSSPVSGWMNTVNAPWLSANQGTISANKSGAKAT